MPPDQSELILSIRAASKSRGLSCQQIVDACTVSGDPVSFNTVQKVLTAPLEDAARCRSGTINAISRAVVGSTSADLETAQSVFDTSAASGIEDRNKQIRRLQSEVDEYRLEVKKKTHTIKSLIVWVFVVTALLLIVSNFLLGYLVWDATHPAQGFIRY